MTRSIFELTPEEKAAIRALELAALLHDVGKLTDGFVTSESEGPRHDFRYRLTTSPDSVFSADIMNNVRALGRDNLRKRLAPGTTEADPRDVQDFTEPLKEGRVTFLDAEYTLAEILLLAMPIVYEHFESRYKTTFAPRSMEPARLIGLLHSIAHFEKDDPEADKTEDETPRSDEASGIRKQTRDQVYRASAFGYESPLQSLDETYRSLPLGDLQEAIVAPDRFRVRQAALESALNKGLGDTRRPINEVTLWDWSYAVNAFARAAAAQIFTQGWPDDGDLGAFLRFQTVRVSLDRLEAMVNSDRISDLLGIKQTLEKSYEDVRALIEDELAFGRQIYADETGAIFLCPAFDLEASELRGSIARLFPPDMQPRVYAGKEIQADTLKRYRFSNEDEDSDAYARAKEEHYSNRRRFIPLFVAEPRKAAKGEAPFQPEQPPAALWSEVWGANGDRHAELCTVCRLRPVGYPRQGDEAEGWSLARWATAKKARERRLCRVCLTRRGRQSEGWLGGDRQGTIWTDEVADDRGRLALLVGRLALDNWLSGQLLDTLMLSPAQGVAKNPSPARLFRIAQEGRSFWEAQLDASIPAAIGRCPYRLKLTPPDEALPDLKKKLGESHAYELHYDGLTLQVVWAGDHFLSAENLAGLARRNAGRLARWAEGDGRQPPTVPDLAELLHGRAAGVHAPSGFLEAGRAEAPSVTLEVAAVEDRYAPQITLLREPGLAMALIPGEQALAAARAVEAAYRQRFARVADRLPLHLGLVYFDRRTPLAAVLDAGRRFLDLPDAWEPWTVETYAGGRVTFIDKAHDRRFTHDYPPSMGDGTTEDEWYPYLLTQDPAQGIAVDRVAHVAKLASGATVYLKPGYFDFEYLDTAGRRYEIAYDGHRRARRPERPLLLAALEGLEAIWQAFAAGLEESQRYQVIGQIEEARQAWFGLDGPDALRRSRNDEAFRRFVEHALDGASWREQPSWDREAAIEAAVGGQLADLAELHMEIMAKAGE